MSAQAPTAIFIDVEVDDSVANDAELAKKLEEVCPVDIFAVSAAGTVEIVAPNLDECILCYQCVETAPDDTVRVVKLYEQP
jgi:NAD-dependent dihydropyrimidine dehydrogenase PreA subunit